MSYKNVNKIDFIQGFRGIAVLMVVFFHGSRFLNPSGLYDSGLGSQLFGGMGSLGVVLFFIISGFIMTITTDKSDGSFRYFAEFCIKRVTRVWPAYVIATIALIVFVRYGLMFFLNHENINLFMKSIFFIPYGELIPPSFGFPLLSVGWTLNFEIYFYFIFGLSLLFGRFRWFFFYSLILLTLLALPYANGNVISIDTSVNYNFSSNFMHVVTSPIIWQFAIGSFIGILYKKNIQIKSKETCWILIFTSVSLVVTQYIARYNISHGVLGWGITLIPMFLIFVICSKTIEIKMPKIFIYLGNISFSLYLWHAFSQELIPVVMNNFGLYSLSNGFPAFILTSSFAIVISSISHKFIENKLSNLLKRKAIAAISDNKFSLQEKKVDI